MNAKYFWRHTKTERINHQQTGAIRNERSPSGKWKMIPARNLELHRGMKSAGNSKYVGECKV